MAINLLNLEIMKKLLLTLTIALFSCGAFSTNSTLNENELLTETSSSIEDEIVGNSCTYYVTITIDHGDGNTETISFENTGPCD